MAGDGTLYLVRSGAEDLVVRDAHEDDHLLVRLLAGGAHTIAELAGALSAPAAAVTEKLDSLVAADVAIVAAESAPLDPPDELRYLRQLPYLAETGDERAMQRRLSGALVVVVGCGGIGTWVVAGLASAGVRRLRLIDDDVVELSNLNRQILYGPSQIGARKVAMTAAWLQRFDERIEVEPVEHRIGGPADAERAVDGADVLVLAADEPPYRLARWVNAACVRRGVPFMTAGQLPPTVKVGPLYWPGRTACFECHERLLRRTSVDYDAYVRSAQEQTSRVATLGPASGIVGATVAMEILHAFTGVTPASAGAALLLDIRTLDMRRTEIPRDPACPICKHAG